MKGVILAAGVASRLRPWTDGVPKCLLPLGGGTLLGRTLDNLEAAGVGEVVLVTGYLEDQIRRYVRERHPRIRASFLTNPVYASTNNIYSLWLVKNEVVDAGMILLDSDILFDFRIIADLVGSGHADALAVKTGGALGDEEIKVEVDAASAVLAIGKHVPPARAMGESIGIEIFSAAALSRLFAVIEGKVIGRGEVNVFYEAAFQEWIDEGGRLRAVDIGERLAIEIDTIEDFRTAERDILPRLPSLR